MLLFFSIILLLLLFVMALTFSDVKMSIENFELSNSDEKHKMSYTLKVGIYFLGKIKVFEVRLNNEKVQKISNKKSIRPILQAIKNNNNVTSRKRDILDIYKKIKTNVSINKLKLRVIIDTEDALLTTYLVGIMSAIMPNLISHSIRKFNKDDYKFEVLPIYQNKNYVYLKLNSIISIKVVHIISMFRVIGGMNNERTSNRRFNVNSYGKY